MKCQCPKPHFFWKPIRKWKFKTQPILVGQAFVKVLPTDLHFKKSDRECSRCGNPLCGDCQVLDAWEDGHDPFGMWIWKDPEDVRIYCRACKEDR